MDFLQPLLQLDHSAIEQSAQLRWAPATAFFVLASAAFVKGPVFVLVGFMRDVRRKMVPVTALSVGASLLLADLLSGAIKQAVDRPRPPRFDPGFEAATAVPASPSFPSGHATTTFACAVAIAILVPRLRWPALALAGIVGVARVYLGVHYTLDVLAGAVLGTLIGAAVALLARRLVAARRVAAPCAQPVSQHS